MQLGRLILSSEFDDDIWFPNSSGGTPPPVGGSFVDPGPGVNGSTTFPASWSIHIPGGTTGGIVDHQGQAVRINTPNLAFDAPGLIHVPEFSEFNVVYLFQFNPGAAVVQYPSVNYRYDAINADGQPNNGYDVYFARNENQVGWERRTGAATADSTVVGFTWGDDLAYNVRINVTAAGVHKIKVWQFPNAEPTSGGVDGLGNIISENDNVHPGPGKFGFFHGAQNANRQAFFTSVAGTYA